MTAAENPVHKLIDLERASRKKRHRPGDKRTRIMNLVGSANGRR